MLLCGAVLRITVLHLLPLHPTPQQRPLFAYPLFFPLKAQKVLSSSLGSACILRSGPWDSTSPLFLQVAVILELLPLVPIRCTPTHCTMSPSYMGLIDSPSSGRCIVSKLRVFLSLSHVRFFVCPISCLRLAVSPHATLSVVARFARLLPRWPLGQVASKVFFPPLLIFPDHRFDRFFLGPAYSLKIFSRRPPFVGDAGCRGQGRSRFAALFRAKARLSLLPIFPSALFLASPPSRPLLEESLVLFPRLRRTFPSRSSSHTLLAFSSNLTTRFPPLELETWLLCEQPLPADDQLGQFCTPRVRDVFILFLLFIKSLKTESLSPLLDLPFDAFYFRIKLTTSLLLFGYPLW